MQNGHDHPPPHHNGQHDEAEALERQLERMALPADLHAALLRAPLLNLPESREALFALATGGGQPRFDVCYDIEGQGTRCEAQVVRGRNGLVVNYPEIYMRRRDPDSLLVGDNGPSDQPRFEERFNIPFAQLRSDVLHWLAQRELLLLPIWAGGGELRFPALLICPLNAAFFAAALADLQTAILGELPHDFSHVRSVMYVAPVFRHTHCEGRQVVVHHRSEDLHEVFSLNLYPGPSAKKGVYGVLLQLGESEGWLTVHGSTVQMVTPYDNTLTLLHEGASGSGKSEMLEYSHREPDGRMLLGHNLLTGERRHIALPQACGIRPVTDDMALCLPSKQSGSKLVVRDAEDAWFVRVNHIADYGVNHELERITVNPERPLIFLNMHGVPDATCLIWEHTMDDAARRCPNPRVILPRELVPGVLDGDVEVDVRSFGVRCPPCTREQPSYGILGLFHVLPPPVAWLWRLVAPRGHDNPSIVDSAGLQSEGVGSFWPFATGQRVPLANLLLRQLRSTPGTRYVLTPNQHIGAWRVSFMPQWLMRDFLARRGGVKFRPEQLVEARSPLLGYCPKNVQIEGVAIPRWFLQVESQPEVGPEGYDAGAEVLQRFFEQELGHLQRDPQLDRLGRAIVEWCLDRAPVDQLDALWS